MIQKKFGFGFAMVVLVVAFIYFGGSPKSKEAISTSQEVSVSKEAPSLKLSEKIRDYPGLAEPRITQQEAQGECKGTLESIETLPLDTLIYDLKHKNLKLECLASFQNLSSFLKGFPQVCEKLENGELSKECVDKLFFYKSLRIHLATINDNLDALSTEIIISKLIGVIAKDNFQSPAEVDSLKLIGSKIYERLPDSESAAKAGLLGYFVDKEMSDLEKIEYDKRMAEILSKFPENWEIYEMNLINTKKNNEELFKKEVEEYFQKYPNSGIANYYMGCLQWTGKQTLLARKFFQKATQLNPKDKRFAETLQKSQTLSPPESICSVSIGFYPDQF